MLSQFLKKILNILFLFAKDCALYRPQAYSSLGIVRMYLFVGSLVLKSACCSAKQNMKPQTVKLVLLFVCFYKKHIKSNKVYKKKKKKYIYITNRHKTRQIYASYKRNRKRL